MRPLRFQLVLLASTVFAATAAISTGSLTAKEPIPTAEDGMAVIRPSGTILDGDTVRVRVFCPKTPAQATCSGSFRLTLPGKKWDLTQGSFAGIGSDEALSVEAKLSRKGRAHARKKRCSFETRAIVTPEATATVSLADVDQQPVTLKRSPGC